MTRVVVVRCESYGEEEIYNAMRSGIGALGELHSLIPQNKKILVKPNFLSYAAPEKAVTTHPMVIKAMLRILYEDGYENVIYGDSSGHGSGKVIAERLGIADRAEEFGAEPADMDTEVILNTPDGSTASVLHLAKGAVDADVIINLCKMKTHALERITGAVKNVYGLVCGARKPAGHVKYPNATVFAGVLADIHRAADIRLHIMDGVVAMEGNGPGSGDPVKMNVLLFSTDPVALDTVYCSLIDLDPQLVPTCTQGQIKGIGTCDMREIEITVINDPEGDAVTVTEAELKEQFGNSSFNVRREPDGKSMMTRALSVLDMFTRRPVIDKRRCVHCGICVEHCPVPGKAVNFKNGKDRPPVYDYRKCIRCYCCQEMCPQKAISVRRG